MCSRGFININHEQRGIERRDDSYIYPKSQNRQRVWKSELMERDVFVHYFKCGTSKATKVEDLVEGDQTDCG